MKAASSPSFANELYDVVIVGAGPVGLSCAIECGLRGLRCLIVELNDRVGTAPRAKTTNVRTRTHLRRWSIADKLAEQAPFGVDYPSTVIFATRLSGKPLATFNDAFNASPARNPLYPEHAQWVPQYKLEQVLRKKVQTLSNVDLHFNTRFVDVNQNDEMVVVSLEAADGQRYNVVASYLIGADGARSDVRESLGIAMSGTYGLSRNYNIVFRAPGLTAAHDLGPAIMYWQINNDAPSLIGPMDGDDIWFFMPTGLDDIRLSDVEAQQMIARATGIDQDFEILSSDFWVASRLLADKYSSGRVFLAGDACHLHPPFGGYGMNMGVADAVDLGWKLAAVIQGWGGRALLDSYETERRPVHQQILDEAVANHAHLANRFLTPDLETLDESGELARQQVGSAIRSEKAREFHTLGAVLGYRYCGSNVIIGAPEHCQLDATIYKPSSEPGCLAPHVWFGDTSLYDRFGSGFTLLVNDGKDATEVVDDAGRLCVPLTVVTLPAGVHDLYPEAMTLVRPDQHVCWRGATWQVGVFEKVSALN